MKQDELIQLLKLLVEVQKQLVEEEKRIVRDLTEIKEILRLDTQKYIDKGFDLAVDSFINEKLGK